MRWSANGRVAALTQLEWAIQVYRPDRALTGRFQALLVLGRSMLVRNVSVTRHESKSSMAALTKKI